jgi:hypothetical protein
MHIVYEPTGLVRRGELMGEMMQVRLHGVCEDCGHDLSWGPVWIPMSVDAAVRETKEL